MTTRKSALTAAVFAILAATALAACSSSGAADSGSTAAADDSRPSWCGPNEASIAFADGNGGNSWKQLALAEGEDEASKCSSVTDFIYTNGQGDTQQAISNVQSLIAQHVGAIVIHADAGEAMLPVITKAYESDIPIVPFRGPVGGEAGVNYSAFSATNDEQIGEIWGTWLKEQLGDEGKVVYMGGPASNLQDPKIAAGMLKAWEGTNIELIGGTEETPWVVTNWDAGLTQRNMSTLLAKYPDIDAVAFDFAAASGLAAFTQDDRQIPLIVGMDNNQLGCTYQELKPTNPDMELLTIDAQTWHIRVAVQEAVALATGGEPPAEIDIEQSIFEDSVSGEPNSPLCDSDLPTDAFLSSRLTAEQQAAALGQ